MCLGWWMFNLDTDLHRYDRFRWAAVAGVGDW